MLSGASKDVDVFPTSEVRLRFIGPARIERADGSVQSLTPGQARVLMHLVAHGHRGATLTELSKAVHPGVESQAGSDRVKAMISRIRRLLGGEVLPENSGRYQLSLADTAVDVWEVKNIKVAETNRVRALDLLSGETFNDDTSAPLKRFKVLVDTHRDRIALEFLNLTVTDAELGDLHQFVAATSINEPLAMALTRHIERLHGPRKAFGFIVHYDSRIRDEVGYTPVHDFEMYRNYLATLCGETPAQQTALGPAESGLLGFTKKPCFGRDHLIADLVPHFTDDSDHGPGIFIQGASGVGKTRVAAALASHVHQEGAHLICIAPDTEATDPFEPFLGRLPGARTRLDAKFGADAETYPIGAVERAVIKEIRRESNFRATLVIVDNAERLGSQSHRLVRRLLTNLRDPQIRFLVVGIEQADKTWVDLQEAVERSGCVSVQVHPLDEVDVESIVRSVHSGHTPATYRSAAREVHEASAGLPATAFILASGLDPQMLLLDTRNDELPLLIGLSDDEITSGQEAAIVGEAVDTRDIAACSEFEHRVVRKLIDSLFAKQFFRRDPGGKEVRFAHTLVRQAFLSSCSPGRLQELHERRAAQTKDLHEKATHLSAAATEENAGKAADALLVSGQILSRRGQYRGALAVFRDYEHLASRFGLPKPDPVAFNHPFAHALARSGLDCRFVVEPGVNEAIRGGDYASAAKVAAAGLPDGEASEDKPWRLAALLRVDQRELDPVDGFEHALHVARLATRQVQVSVASGALETAAKLAATTAQKHRLTLGRWLNSTLSPANDQLLPDLRAAAKSTDPALAVRGRQSEALKLLQLGHNARSCIEQFHRAAFVSDEELRMWHALTLQATIHSLDGNEDQAADAADEAMSYGIGAEIPIAVEVGTGQIFWQRWLRSEHHTLADLIDRDGGVSGLAQAAAASTLDAAGDTKTALDLAVKCVRSGAKEPTINTVEVIAMIAPVLGRLDPGEGAFKAARQILAPYTGLQSVAGFGFWHLGPITRALSHLAIGEAEAEKLTAQAQKEAVDAGFAIWIDKLDDTWANRLISMAAQR